MNDTEKFTGPISDKALERLAQYVHYLRRREAEGLEVISAVTIASDLGVYHTQVRKDLALTGLVGVPKVGHKVKDLIKAIEHFLNWDNVHDAFLVGVGNIGNALIKYRGFETSGIKIVAGFDVDKALIGKEINGIPIYHTDKLIDLANRLKIKIGIITTPAEHAQEVAEMMVEGGILAIWNFAPVVLKVPPDIIVQNVELYSSLAVLSQKLKSKLEADGDIPQINEEEQKEEEEKQK